MTAYEWGNLTVGILTLGVLSWTLYVLSGYARDTKTLADTAVEQLPRPWVVLKRSADPSDMAVLGGTTVSLTDDQNPFNPLIFMNVGTGPAVNCRYHVRDTGGTGEGKASYQLPEIGPSDSFKSTHILNALPANAVVIIEYESVAGSRYRTDITIEDNKWVQGKIRFISPHSQENI